MLFVNYTLPEIPSIGLFYSTPFRLVAQTQDGNVSVDLESTIGRATFGQAQISISQQGELVFLTLQDYNSQHTKRIRISNTYEPVAVRLTVATDLAGNQVEAVSASEEIQGYNTYGGFPSSYSEIAMPFSH